MASDASVPNNFVTGAPSVADDVDANFAALVAWINTNAVHLDASKAFTGVPTGPASDPTTDNQLARKAYVDALSRSRGLVAAPATRIGYQTSVTSTEVDMTSMSITFTALAGRRYRIVGFGLATSTVSGDTATLVVTDGSNVVQGTRGLVPLSSGYSVSVRCEAIVSPGAGSVTYKLRGKRWTGSGNLTYGDGAEIGMQMYIEDIGA